MNRSIRTKAFRTCQFRYIVTWRDCAQPDDDGGRWTVLGLCKSIDEFMRLRPIGGYMGYRLHAVGAPDNQVPLVEIQNYTPLSPSAVFEGLSPFEKMRGRWVNHATKMLGECGYSPAEIEVHRWHCQGECRRMLRVPPHVARVCDNCTTTVMMKNRGEL